MSRVDSNVMRVYRQLNPEPKKADVPELFDGNVKFIKEGGALLQDNAGTGRTEPVQLFLFNTCLLICRRSDKVGKWDLRVLMRMNDSVRVDPKGGLLFSVTAKGRTFSFGCLEQHEVGVWTKALNQAINDNSADVSSATEKAEDPKLGGLLLGLKGALGGDDDDVADDAPLQRNSSSTKSAPAATATAAAAAADDDDDPFAAIARRPSLNNAKPAAAPVVAGGFDLFATATTPVQPTPAAAPAASGGALSTDALMRLYAQSAAPAPTPVAMAAPALHPTGPNYNLTFGGSPAGGAAGFGGGGGFPPAQAPYAQVHPQQPLFGGVPQQQQSFFGVPQQQQQQAAPQQSNVDPFASLL